MAMDLTDVSKTAIITLRSRMIESEKNSLKFSDPKARTLFDNLKLVFPGYLNESVFIKKLSSTLTSHLAIRARKYDAIANEFISKNPGCTVVSLGCGFDTRYWRISNSNCTYIELDLPEVISIKREALKDILNYELIGCSVLDTSWIKQITSKRNEKVLLIAEGLFMYLHKKDVISLFKEFSKSFHDSQIAFEVVTEKYTRGFWKKIVEMKMKKSIGLDAGSSFNFGIKKASEIETYAEGIKILNEWSYVEEPEVPNFYKYLGVSRTQWTVTANINNKI